VVAYLLIYVLILKLHVGLPVDGLSPALDRKLQVEPAGVHLAYHLPRYCPHRDNGQADEVERARGQQHGLRSHGLVEGPARKDHRHAARPQEQPHTGAHDGRHGISMIFGGSVIEETIFAIPGDGAASGKGSVEQRLRGDPGLHADPRRQSSSSSI